MNEASEWIYIEYMFKSCQLIFERPLTAVHNMGTGSPVIFGLKSKCTDWNSKPADHSSGWNYALCIGHLSDKKGCYWFGLQILTFWNQALAQFFISRCHLKHLFSLAGCQRNQPNAYEKAVTL